MKEIILPKLKKRKRVSFFLGTDKYAGKNTTEQETRVGITPTQLFRLRSVLNDANIDLESFVVSGAGERSFFSDDEYKKAYARIVREQELSSIKDIDVLHSLKEPASYECSIGGTFLRIGALHRGDISKNKEDIRVKLLKKNKVYAFFDGSTIGGTSLKFFGLPSAPIKASMSKFAGIIAAKKVIDNANGYGKVVIVGGGVVGENALQEFLKCNNEKITEIYLYEKNLSLVNVLSKKYKNFENLKIIHSNQNVKINLEWALGLILAAYIPSQKTPHVVNCKDLLKMKRRSVVVDVATDEGGSIELNEDQGFSEDFLKNNKFMTYIAEQNLPRLYGREASEVHGEAIFPYLLVLLFLVAKNGSISAAVDEIKNSKEPMKIEDENDYLQVLKCDLRNGLVQDLS